MSFFYNQENTEDRKSSEKRQCNAGMGWNTENTTFDLANGFTYNPRLMSPSNFRSPPKVPSFSDDLISFNNGMGLGAFDSQYTDVRASQPECLYPTTKCQRTSQKSLSLSPEGQMPSFEGQIPSSEVNQILSLEVEDQALSLPIYILSPEGQTLSSEGHTSPPQVHTSPSKSLIFSPEGQAVSPEDYTSSLEGQTSTPFSSYSTPAHNKSFKSCERSNDSEGISLFSDTRFNTADEVGEYEYETISNFSDSSSSNLNWSLSASYSNCASSISQGDSVRSDRKNNDDNSSEEFVKRRRRRKLSFSSPPSIPPDGTEYVSSSYFENKYRQREDFSPTRSLCSEEVSHILTGAQTPGRHYSEKKTPDVKIQCCHGNPRIRGSSEVMNWDKFQTSWKENVWSPVKRKVLTPFYPHGNSACKAAHCIQRRVGGRTVASKANRKVSPLKVSAAASKVTFETAWPALPHREYVQPKTSLPSDPAILSVGEVLPDHRTSCNSSRPNAWPRKVNTLGMESRNRPTSQYQNIDLPLLLNTTRHQQLAHSYLQANTKHAQFDALLQDPAVVYACRRNDIISTPPDRVLWNRVILPLIWEGCRASLKANDPAVLGIGKPVFSIHAEAPSRSHTNRY